MATRELLCAGLAPFASAPNIPYIALLTVVPLFLTDTIVLPLQGLVAAEANGVMPTGGETGMEGTGRKVTHYAQGVVKESGIAVCRSVCAVQRGSLAVLATALSEVDGRFHLEWRGYSGKEVILIFDDATDALDYNCKVFDLVESVY